MPSLLILLVWDQERHLACKNTPPLQQPRKVFLWRALGDPDSPLKCQDTEGLVSVLEVRHPLILNNAKVQEQRHSRPAFEVDSSQRHSPSCHWTDLQSADALSPAQHQ